MIELKEQLRARGLRVLRAGCGKLSAEGRKTDLSPATPMHWPNRLAQHEPPERTSVLRETDLSPLFLHARFPRRPERP